MLAEQTPIIFQGAALRLVHEGATRPTPRRSSPGGARRLQGHHHPRHERPGPRRALHHRRHGADQHVAGRARRRRSRTRASSRIERGSRPSTAWTCTTALSSRWTLEPATSSPTSAAPGYYREDLASPQLDPKFDVAGRGYRQSGSAWKPLVYAAGFDAGTVTPGTLLLDVTTEFARDWFPRDADQKERGPVLMRDALTYSLNIPAIRALDRIGVETVATLASSLDISFPRGDRHLLQAGLAGAIGTAETNMVELTAAYGAMANNGVLVEPRTILEIQDSHGNIIPSAGQNAPRQVVSQQAAWLMTDILKDSTDPLVNNIFGPRLQIVNGVADPLVPGSDRRPAAAKTGTTNDLRDLSVYGYLPVQQDPNLPVIVASVWMGNSDHSPPLGGRRIDHRGRRSRSHLVLVPARLHQGLADRAVPASAIGRRVGNDRSVVGRRARSVDARDAIRILHRGHAAGRRKPGRPKWSPLPPDVRQLVRRPDQGRGRTARAMDRSGPRLDGSRAARYRSSRAARIDDGPPLRTSRLGRLHRARRLFECADADSATHRRNAAADTTAERLTAARRDAQAGQDT